MQRIFLSLSAAIREAFGSFFLSSLITVDAKKDQDRLESRSWGCAYRKHKRGNGFLKGAARSCETDVLPGTTQNLCGRILLVAVSEFVRKAPSPRRDAPAGPAIQGAAGQTPP